MSDKLAISSALSVLLMAAYVLFSPNAAQGPLPADSSSMLVNAEVSVPALPTSLKLLPFSR